MLISSQIYKEFFYVSPQGLTVPSWIAFGAWCVAWQVAPSQQHEN